jgi:hypothetical protein
VVGALAVAFATSVGTHGSPREQATFGLPIFMLVLTFCLLAVLTLTAERTGVSGPALATGALTSLGVAGWWLAVQFAFPPIPASIGGAVVATGFGIGAVVFLGARRDDGAQETLLAVFGVAAVTPLLIFAELLVLSDYAPARLIPNLVPAALSPADNLANSRIEVQDPYVALLLLAGLAAIALTAAGLAGRRPRLDVA